MSRLYLSNPCALLSTFSTRRCGRSRRPAFPAPSSVEEGQRDEKPGQVVPRQRERMPFSVLSCTWPWLWTLHLNSCSASAIRASFWSIAHTCPFSASICGPVAGSSAPMAAPQAEHCTSVSLRLSPIGVNSASSKLCPPHLLQLEVAICVSYGPI